MASISLYQKKTRDLNGWGSWGTVSGDTYISSEYNMHTVYKATVNMAGASSMNSVTLSTVLGCTGTVAATIHAYLYTSDPTSGGSGSPPSTYVGHYQTTRTIDENGLYLSFPISGLSLNVSTVYIWVTASYNVNNGVLSTYDNTDVPQYRNITATFTAAVMSLEITPSTVTSGNAVTLNVANGSGYTLTATFKYGSTTLAVQSFSYGSVNVTCPKSWFDTAGVTYLTSMTVNVTVTGGTSTMSGSFTLQAGDDMKPSVGTPTAAIVQASSASDFPNTYISGISKCKVSASVSFPTNAGVSSVRLSYPGGTTVNMSYNSSTGKYEGTTAAPITGNTTFTVTATDLRGLYTQKTVSITGVVAYTEPSVVVNLAYRCDSSGSAESGGAYWRIKVTASYTTGLSGNSLRKLTAAVKNGTANNLTSGTLSGPLSGTTNPKIAYTIVITVQDKVSGEITKEIVLEGMLRNVVITRSGDGTYVGIGTTPESTSGESTVELPGGGRFMVGGENYGAFANLVDTDIAQYLSDNSSFGNDFLNVDRENRYAKKNAASTFSSWAGACDNTPSNVASQIFGGLRLVFVLSSAVAVVLLIETTPTPGRIWINVYSSTAWAGWKYFISYNAS